MMQGMKALIRCIIVHSLEALLRPGRLPAAEKGQIVCKGDGNLEQSVR